MPWRRPARPGTPCAEHPPLGAKLARMPSAHPGHTPAPASAALFARAQAVVPGGVNSPVRAFRSVGGTPRFVARAAGAYLIDADGREYVDLIGSWGPHL